jgi:hypothetical protein
MKDEEAKKLSAKGRRLKGRKRIKDRNEES